MLRLLRKPEHSPPASEQQDDKDCQQEPKLVVAHFLVGNTAPYTLTDWEEDIVLASSCGIDGFALNVGKDKWQLDQVSACFEATQRSGMIFQLFFSFDMSSLPSSTAHDVLYLKEYISRFARHPRYLYYRGKALVSTFAGENALFGRDNFESAWTTVKTILEDVCPIFFVPSFFVDPRRFRTMRFIDGAFNWNGCWPVHLSLDSPLEEVRFPKFRSDVEYLHNLRTDHGHRKAYMASVSPWFFTHYGPDSWNKNWIYRGDDWLAVRRWQELINIHEEIDIVQIISWNDYGESHYIGPIKGAQPDSEAWVNGFEHTAWLHLYSYFAHAFKDIHRRLTKDAAPIDVEDRVYLWARPHSRDAEAHADQVGKPKNWELTEDVFWAVILAHAPAYSLLRSGNTEVKASVPAGLSLLSCPLQPGCGMHIMLIRDNMNVIDFMPTDFVFNRHPKFYNFNAYVTTYPPLSQQVSQKVEGQV